MSQVTKPIALDETLQDVVTAIQGITQGGMIVSTGTVGSSTQPVYINGGVPTAGMNFAITTGTPTNINSYLTATRTEVHKSGNVVHVNLKFTILSGWSNTASTQICKLPWLPTTSYPWLSRMAGPSTDSSDHYMSSAYIDTTGYICLGEGPYTGLTAGNSIWVYGTYLTNA